ncbi:rhodanese-like domain-containing protein 9, chloroplastic [Primulina eburnea]|uniref:rhodanese-like domain-containing protein 9, chloroplastic n=1 Tax=Primulina eburnea TaxID=1245227 RepID=UPI003C6C7F2C
MDPSRQPATTVAIRREREWEDSSTLGEMTGISCCCSSTLSARSNLATSWSVLGTHQVQTPKVSRLPRRNLVIKAEVKFVNSEEAKKLIAVEGFAVLDVRDRIQFERAHIKDCYHIPLFIENKDNDLGTIIKRTVHNNFSGLFFGLPFTKANPEFVQSVRSQFSPESKLLLVCQEGLRSASAAYKLEEAGYQNIACVTSGLQSVTTGTFDSVGSTELKDAGKAGLITIQGKISAVLGTVLICAFLFVTFFPDQAEKLFQLAPTS